jgi:predicted SnoaL-like aldol condensation-catalyzing enzyme
MADGDRSKEERNKETVMRFFDAFRRGDTDIYDELLVEDYKQHNPQLNTGRDAVKAFFKPIGKIDFDVYRVIAEGDFVVVHTHFKTWNTAAMDIFRLNDEGKLIEHWDVLQPTPLLPNATVSGHDMFTQLTP